MKSWAHPFIQPFQQVAARLMWVLYILYPRLMRSWCWWFRNPAITGWYGQSSISFSVLSISGGCLGFLPSTVCHPNFVLVFCMVCDPKHSEFSLWGLSFWVEPTCFFVFYTRDFFLLSNMSTHFRWIWMTESHPNSCNSCWKKCKAGWEIWRFFLTWACMVQTGHGRWTHRQYQRWRGVVWLQFDKTFAFLTLPGEMLQFD